MAGAFLCTLQMVPFIMLNLLVIIYLRTYFTSCKILLVTSLLSFIYLDNN